MKPNKLYESLFILHKCTTTIQKLWEIIDIPEGFTEKTDGSWHLLANYITMESVTFLEEFNGAFNQNIEEEYINRVREVRKITSPVLKRINKWKDLKSFRNSIIAHPWRNRGEFVVPNPQCYNIPRNWFEYGVLALLISYVWYIIRSEFEEEFGDSTQYVAGLKLPSKEPPDYKNLNADHLKMAEEVANICKAFNKPYFLKIFLYRFSDSH